MLRLLIVFELHHEDAKQLSDSEQVCNITDLLYSTIESVLKKKSYLCQHAVLWQSFYVIIAQDLFEFSIAGPFERIATNSKIACNTIEISENWTMPAQRHEYNFFRYRLYYKQLLLQCSKEVFLAPKALYYNPFLLQLSFETLFGGQCGQKPLNAGSTNVKV